MRNDHAQCRFVQDIRRAAGNEEILGFDVRVRFLANRERADAVAPDTSCQFSAAVDSNRVPFAA